jgi:hypothetical protein
MVNQEKLSLNVCVRQETILDGNSLKNDIINHLSCLKKFD